MRTHALLSRTLAVFLALAGMLPSAHALVKVLAPAGTVLNVPHNYSWGLMTTINVYNGGVVPFDAYSANTFGGLAGNYTFTMTTAGFPGAINLYQNFFDPFQPNANFYVNGVVTNKAGTISLTANFPANSLFTVVFSGATNGSSGTYTASVTSPGAVTVTTNTKVSIVTHPLDKTIASGDSAALHVYAVGPLAHKWQWYGGNAPFTNNPIPGATNASYFTGPLIVSSTSYWVKVTGPTVASGAATSSTADITITGNINANYGGTLTTNGCKLGNGNPYAVQRFQIQSGGNYAFTITPGFTLTTYQGVFDSASPNANLWGILNGYYAPGTYDLVISKSGGGVFAGAIGGGPAIVNLPAALPPQFLSSPADTTIPPGQTATMKVSTTCGTPFTLQWYKGNSGVTTAPIAGATSQIYTTPVITSNTMYWARMTFAGGTVDSGAGTVYLNAGPIFMKGALTTCDRTFNRPASAVALTGSSCFYKYFVFNAATEGDYTFAISSPGTSTKSFLYQGGFDPNNPLVNVYAVESGGPFVSHLLPGPTPYVLVISGFYPTNVGNFAITNTVGPALLTFKPPPVITTQPANTNVFRNQTATLSVVSTNLNAAFQWYTGSDCQSKSLIPGANSNSYTTPPLTDFLKYYVEVTTPGGYLFSTQAVAGVKPLASNDTFSASLEDGSKFMLPAGALANDTKADTKTLTAVNFTQPAHGSVSGTNNGSFAYTPVTNYFGTDSFTYQASDGSVTSAPATVNLTINPVADTPTVTGATTVQGVQTTSGLVISRNVVDGAEVTHFKITGITNGILYKNNGTTLIGNGNFITFAEGNAGLRFTPGLAGPGATFGFNVQASVNATDGGLGGGIAVASVTVIPGVAPTITCVADIITNTALAACTRSVVLNVAASGGTPAPTISYKLNGNTIASPYAFPSGTNTVTATADNGVLPNATCNFQVIVQDTEPPVVTCPGDIITNSVGGCPIAVGFHPGITDNCTITSVTVTPTNGNVFPVGTNAVTITAVDGAFHTNSCTFNVIVLSNPAPGPVLSIDVNVTNAEVYLMWPGGYPCLTLQHTALLESPLSNTVWTPYPGPYGATKSGNVIVTNAMKQSIFYRLSN